MKDVNTRPFQLLLPSLRPSISPSRFPFPLRYTYAPGNYFRAVLLLTLPSAWAVAAWRLGHTFMLTVLSMAEPHSFPPSPDKHPHANKPNYLNTNFGLSFPSHDGALPFSVAAGGGGCCARGRAGGGLGETWKLMFEILTPYISSVILVYSSRRGRRPLCARQCFLTPSKNERVHPSHTTLKLASDSTLSLRSRVYLCSFAFAPTSCCIFPKSPSCSGKSLHFPLPSCLPAPVPSRASAVAQVPQRAEQVVPARVLHYVIGVPVHVQQRTACGCASLLNNWRACLPSAVSLSSCLHASNCAILFTLVRTYVFHCVWILTRLC